MGLEHIPLPGSVGRVFWGFWLRPDSPIQTKRRVLVTSQQSYLRGAREDGPRRQGTLLITRALGEVTSDLVACDSVGCYLGHALVWGGGGG